MSARFEKNTRAQSDLVTMAITAIVVIAIGLALFFIFRRLFNV